MAADVVRRIREVTDKPIKYVVLSHYHAVRVLGAAGYFEGAEHILASQDTRDLIVERGEAGQGQRNRPLPAPVPERRNRAPGPDLAHHDLHRQDDAVARQARGAD
jgi:glyoxylase-like metal-dependent hydrolase (beta-lactamase superfamily II)